MSESVDIFLPDIGDHKEVPIVELNVSVGDRISIDTPLLTVESDKATMEVPSQLAGVVKNIRVAVGTLVSKGTLLMTVEPEINSAAGAHLQTPPRSSSTVPPAPVEATPSVQTSSLPQTISLAGRTSHGTTGQTPHATPSVRALARKLGANLVDVRPSGPKGRLLREDLIAYVKGAIEHASSPARDSKAVAPDWPKVDYEKFGPIVRSPLSRIQRIAGANLSRNWNAIPHVTNFENADVTDAEEFRKATNAGLAADRSRLTMVSMLIKASALALKTYPRFNASLDGDELVLKNYVHVGFAVDTPRGLMVPVIRDCDKKGLLDIASEMRTLADKAIAGTLPASDMQGGCFSVSSLGGVGGAGFTPIINAPEVAILGAGRATIEAIWDSTAFQPRLVLPISLSWDHRVVDGVAAARFLGFVAALLSDLRRTAL